MKGDFNKAVLNYNKAREIKPDYADAYNNLAWIMATCSDKKYRNGTLAIAFAKKALTLSKDSRFLDTLAAAHAEAGHFEKATEIQKGVIKIVTAKGKTRNLPELRAHLISYEKHLPWRITNRIEDFKQAPEKAIVKSEPPKEKPTAKITQSTPTPSKDIPTPKLRSKEPNKVAIVSTKKVEQAETKNVAKVMPAKPQQERKGTKIAPVARPVKPAAEEPEDPSHYYKKGMVWEMKGHFDRAIKNYNKAREKNPDYAYAYNNLAWIMATCPDKTYRNGTRAIGFAEKAIRLNKDIGFLDTLAAAYAEAGNFEKARTIQKGALKILIEEGQTRNIPIFQAHLICYERQLPWRITNRIDDFKPPAVQAAAGSKKVAAKPANEITQKTLPPSKEKTGEKVRVQEPKKVKKTQVVLAGKVKQPEIKAVANGKPAGPQGVIKKTKISPVALPVKPVIKEPANPTHFFNRGMSAEIKGDFNQAIINYNKTIKVAPEYAPAYNNLAWIMATCPDKRYRNGSQAIEFAEKASSLGKQVDSLDTLAAAYAEAGKFKKAATIQKDAIIALIMNNQTGLLPGYRAHLISYETHQPWRITNSIEDFKSPPIKSPVGEPRQQSETSVLTSNTVTPGQKNKDMPSTKKRSEYPYTILVCSFKDMKEANAFAEKLRADGKSAFTCPTHIPDKGDWYRVFSGSFKTIEKTREVSSVFREIQDINPLEAKMPYAVQVGIFNSDTELKQREGDLRSRGYLAYSLPDATDNDKSRLLIGAYRTEKDALELTRILQQAGLNPEIVRR